MPSLPKLHRFYPRCTLASHRFSLKPHRPSGFSTYTLAALTVIKYTHLRLPRLRSMFTKSSAEVDHTPFNVVDEGLASILVHVEPNGASDGPKAVFYNPIQQFNRDLSVLSIKTFAEQFVSDKRKQLRNSKGKRKHLVTPVKTPTLPADQPTDIPTLSADIPSTSDFSIRFSVLDALSATGLRALRYALEIPEITSITANDLEPCAIESINRNIQFNLKKEVPDEFFHVPPPQAMAKISVQLGDAQHHMYGVLASSSRSGNLLSRGLPAEFPSHKYDVIDLDPYGTAAPFFDAAVQAVSDGGLLCVTCTDAGVWASTGYAEKCYSLYGGTPAKADWCHEAGLRLILHSIAASAGRYGLTIEPLLSLSIDFYARVFVKVWKSPAEVKNLASRSIIVYNCDVGCGSWVTQPLGKAKEAPDKRGQGTFMKYSLARAPTSAEHCAICGSIMHLAGPMWGGPLHSSKFAEAVLAQLTPESGSIYGTAPRMKGVLQTALEETALSDSPFFHVPSRLARTLHCQAPPLAALRGALLGLGYHVSLSHCKPYSIKTNASQYIMWAVMKKWTEQRPINQGALKDTSPGYHILHAVSTDNLDICFDKEKGRYPVKGAGMVRYQMNPKPNWGPIAKAKREGHLRTSAQTEQPRDERETKRLKFTRDSAS